jgi:hypothetical protein
MSTLPAGGTGMKSANEVSSCEPDGRHYAVPMTISIILHCRRIKDWFVPALGGGAQLTLLCRA